MESRSREGLVILLTSGAIGHIPWALNVRLPGLITLSIQTPGLAGIAAAGLCVDGVPRLGLNRYELAILSYVSLLGIAFAVLPMTKQDLWRAFLSDVQSFGFAGLYATYFEFISGWRRWLLGIISASIFLYTSQSKELDWKTFLPPESEGLDKLEPLARHSSMNCTLNVMVIFALTVLFNIAKSTTIALYKLRRWRDKHFRKPAVMFVEDFMTEVPGDCAICLGPLAEKVDENGLLRLLCKHTFHNVCISNWLDKSAECPVCRVATHDICQCTLLLPRSDDQSVTVDMPMAPIHAGSEG